MTTKEEAFRAAAKVLVTGALADDLKTIDQLVNDAYTPTGPTKAELRQMIRDNRRKRGMYVPD